MTPGNKTGFLKKLSLIGFPFLTVLFIFLFDLDPGKPQITYTAAIAFLMAAWWITETIPLAVTALLPVILFPLFGIMDGKLVSSQYFNHIIFIFIGGFIVALAMERWNLHKRIALRILMFFGVRPRFILLGFMLATAMLSMWISNTATAMMMIPISIAIITKLEETAEPKIIKRFSVGIFLGIAYSASIGGVATLIGTPPNLSFARILNIFFPKAPEISFSKWFLMAFPISIIFLIITWVILSYIFCPRKDLKINREVFIKQYRQLGHMNFEEKIVLGNFILLVYLWMFRANITIGSFIIPGWSNIFPQARFINDGTIAILIAFILFIIPSRSKIGTSIMNWKTAVKLPWNIVLLFGGGFALATGFKKSGLSAFMGQKLNGIGNLSPVLIIVIVCLFITFLTELTSNTATAEILLPILAAMAVTLKINPLFLMIPGTLSCSFAFMLPVATPPNAIIFGTERVSIKEMAKTGIILNLIGVLIITLAIFFLGKVILGIDLTQMPDWMI